MWKKTKLTAYDVSMQEQQGRGNREAGGGGSAGGAATTMSPPASPRSGGLSLRPRWMASRDDLRRRRELFLREVEATTGFLTAHFALLGLFRRRGQESAFRDLLREQIFAELFVYDGEMIAMWRRQICSFKILFSTASPFGNCSRFLAQVQVSSLEINVLPAHWWYVDIMCGRVVISESVQEGEAVAPSYAIYEREGR